MEKHEQKRNRKNTTLNTICKTCSGRKNLTRLHDDDDDDWRGGTATELLCPCACARRRRRFAYGCSFAVVRVVVFVCVSAARVRIVRIVQIALHDFEASTRTHRRYSASKCGRAGGLHRATYELSSHTKYRTRLRPKTPSGFASVMFCSRFIFIFSSHVLTLRAQRDEKFTSRRGRVFFSSWCDDRAAHSCMDVSVCVCVWYLRVHKCELECAPCADVGTRGTKIRLFVAVLGVKVIGY